LKSTDHDLLEALARGGKAADQALRGLYLDMRAAIASLVRDNSGSEEDAKDVMQAAVIAFYENVKNGRFKGESAVSTYLYAIARFIWLNKLKRKGLEISKLERSGAADYEPELPRRIAEGESKQQLLALFGRLGADCQRVLMDSMYHDLDMKEIASAMGYDNEQVARNKKYLCLKKLKEMLKAEPGLLNYLP
jgi:RNA polymerase sigma factor (sigma-70 family)